MTVTLTYDSTLARIAITANALAAADVASIERSTDQVRWTTVRGAVALPVSAGALASTHYDYEFVPGVVNYYRVRGIETGAITFVGVGAAATSNNASLVPAHPAGLIEGDLKVTLASIRNSGTGTVNTPAGWTVMRTFGNVSLLGRRHAAGDVAPTITFAGGVAGADTLARMAAFRRAELTPVTGVDLLNPSAQDIPYPALTVPRDDLLLIDAAWKQDDYSALTFRAGHTTIGGASSTAGDDAAMSWSYQIQTDATDQPAGTHVVTGGAAAISRNMTVALQHAAYLNEQTANVTPTLTSVWLKSPIRPFLNMSVSLGGRDFEADRAGRGEVFDVLDRTLPVGVTQPQGSKRFSLLVRTTTALEARNLEFLLASGDSVYLHAPDGKVVPSGGIHVMVDSSRERRVRVNGERRHWTIPVREVAAPGPDIDYALLTWQTILSTYGGLDALLAANATLDALLSLLAAPSEVIVD